MLQKPGAAPTRQPLTSSKPSSSALCYHKRTYMSEIHVYRDYGRRLLLVPAFGVCSSQVGISAQAQRRAQK